MKSHKKFFIKKKTLFLTITTLILIGILAMSIYYITSKYLLKTAFEKNILTFTNKNADTIFYIDKISYFSSVDAKNKYYTPNSYTLENLYQYTDIAIYLESLLKEKSEKNTLKSLTIENVEFSQLPHTGTPALYFKSINNFSKSDFSEENKINNKLDFAITSEDKNSLETPTLYNNLANPITLSYVNQNIKSSYIINDTSIPIAYNGTLLKKCNIPSDSIKSRVSFDIVITNNLDEQYKCSVHLDLPFMKNVSWGQGFFNTFG